jgi:hypothetical protein
MLCFDSFHLFQQLLGKNNLQKNAGTLIYNALVKVKTC